MIKMACGFWSFLGISLQVEFCAWVCFKALDIPAGSYLDKDFPS